MYVLSAGMFAVFKYTSEQESTAGDYKLALVGVSFSQSAWFVRCMTLKEKL